MNEDRPQKFRPFTSQASLHRIMSFFKFTTDKTVKQLRWVMVFTIVFDKFCTLIGQPNSYWHHPETMIEGNQFVRQFLGQGLTVYIPFSVAYIFLMVLLASIIPRKLALVLIFYGIFGHYFAASTWLVYRFHFGVNACAIYGIFVGVVLVQLIFPKSANVSKEPFSSNDPDV